MSSREAIERERERYRAFCIGMFTVTPLLSGGVLAYFLSDRLSPLGTHFYALEELQIAVAMWILLICVGSEGFSKALRQSKRLATVVVMGGFAVIAIVLSPIEETVAQIGGLVGAISLWAAVASVRSRGDGDGAASRSELASLKESA